MNLLWARRFLITRCLSCSPYKIQTPPDENSILPAPSPLATYGDVISYSVCDWLTSVPASIVPNVNLSEHQRHRIVIPKLTINETVLHVDTNMKFINLYNLYIHKTMTAIKYSHLLVRNNGSTGSTGSKM